MPLTTEAAHADRLRPIEAKSIDLGEVSGVAYYTVAAALKSVWLRSPSAAIGTIRSALARRFAELKT